MTEVTPEYGFPLPSDQSRISAFPWHLRALSRTLEEKLPNAIRRWGGEAIARAETAAARVAGTQLSSTRDLDTATTPGPYRSAGSSDYAAAHYPTANPGELRVIAITADENHVMQVYTSRDGTIWHRQRPGAAASWTTWTQVGSPALPIVIVAGGTDLGTLARGTVGAVGGGTVGGPPGFSVGTVETLPIVAGSTHLLQRATSDTGRVWTRRMTAGTWGAWTEVGGAALPTVTWAAGQDIATLPLGRIAAVGGGALGVPPGFTVGSVMHLPIVAGSTHSIMLAVGDAGRMWTRRQTSGAWGAWAEVSPDMTAVPTTATARPGSGTKLIRVPVTVGHNPAAAPAVTTRGVARLPLRWNFPVIRWRLRVQNADIRSGDTSRTGTATVTGVWVGKHAAGGAFESDPVKALDTFTVSASETVTPWTAAPIPTGPTGEALLSLGWTATGDHWPQLGTAYLGTDAAAAGDRVAANLSPSLSAPWSIVVELETWATTPVLASMGDSISVGVGSARGTAEAWLVQYAQPRGIVPVLGGSSGDRAAASTDLGAFKWTRWLSAESARPDALVWALGVNDFGNGASDQQLRDTLSTVLPRVAARIPALHLTEVTPRTGVPLSDPREAARVTHNQWRRTLPLGARSCWPTVAAVSATGDDLDAGKDADGLHPNSSGHAALAGALGVMTSPPVAYQVVAE